MVYSICGSRALRDTSKVEEYFIRLGYYITSGDLFGGDLLLYQSSPETCHAKYLVLIDNSYTWRDIISAARVANQNNKELLLVFNQFDDILIYSINRAID